MKCLMLIMFYSGKTHVKLQATVQEDLDKISKLSDLHVLTIFNRQNL